MMEIDFGQPLPSNLEYAISFGIPTWDSAISYAGKDPKTLSRMATGYPRYFPQPAIQKLCEFFVIKYGRGSEGCRPFPSLNSAQKCLEYVRKIYGRESKAHLETETLIFGKKFNQKPEESAKLRVVIAAVIASDDEFEIVKEYWKLTGEGVSSRLAVFVTQFLGSVSVQLSDQAEARISLTIEKGEEAKRLIKQRVSDNHSKPFGLEAKDLSGSNIVLQPLKDVHLVSSGMAAIFTARKLLNFWEQSKTSKLMSNGDNSQNKEQPLPCVIFGFPFKDTQVIMEKFGSTKFYGFGDSRDLTELESFLERKQNILAVFVETPSNPLLNMPDLIKLKSLANKHGFFIIIDDTVGGLNVNVLPYADIICTSITKLFSGASNVMGGSLLLNPKSSLYHCAREYFVSSEFEDLLWYEDAIVLEANSRDFEDRTIRANKNAEELIRKLLLPQEGGVIKKVYYPTVSSEETFKNYTILRNERGGYGCLLSVSFYTEEDARAFYDTLKVYKGPSNGTNFTLACSYVQLAHQFELEEVSKFGADPNLVRVSVGLENIQWLLNVFSVSLDAVRQRRSHN